MARNEEVDELRKKVLLLEEEVERLSTPPYISGTLLEVGKKTARVAVDGAGVIEVMANGSMPKEVNHGDRVILNPQTRAIVGTSEFSTLDGEIVTVDEVLGSRLRVQYNGTPCLVLHAMKEIKPGDEVRLDPAGVMAVERFDRKSTKYSLERVQTAPWSNIGGLEDTISKIKEEVEEPFVHKEVYARYGRQPAKGILLYGPPGCGKTLIAKSIAYNLAQRTKGPQESTDGHFINIKGPEILEKWVGNTEANVRRIYEAAREVASRNGTPVVVFFDEAEAVLKVRGSGISTDVYDSIVPQFLTEMDGMDGNYNVITVLATNREDIIDPAILRDGRVDRRIKVPRPSQAGAAEIFSIYLKGKPLESTSMFSKEDPKELAQHMAAQLYDEQNIAYNVVSPREGVLGCFHYCDLVSGAMIKGIVDRASTFAIKREVAKGKPGISRADLEQAVQDEFSDVASFSQTLIRDDWETVFGPQGRQYQMACQQGALVLENAIKYKR